MAKASRKSVGGGTREALILAAERLIAEYGIDGVSLRQINSAAGQRNSSAAHYHFGSKEALIRSIYEYRMDSVNRRRQELVDRVRAEGRGGDIRSIVETFIRPIVDEIRGSAGGSYYIRFLAQAMGHPQADARDYACSILTEAAKQAYELLNKAMPDVREPLFGQRFGLMWELIVHSLADRERYTGPGCDISDADAELFVSNLIDVVAGAMGAPLAAETTRLLRR
jgi:AcrR family transcriptional regulator